MKSAPRERFTDLSFRARTDDSRGRAGRDRVVARDDSAPERAQRRGGRGLDPRGRTNVGLVGFGAGWR